MEFFHNRQEVLGFQCIILRIKLLSELQYSISFGIKIQIIDLKYRSELE